MTIFRFSLAVAAVLLVAAAGRVGAAQHAVNGDECANIDPFTQRRCVSARIERNEAAMNKLFAQARAAIARSYDHNGKYDTRTHPRFLDRSQAEWRRFVMDNCTVTAAYGASSNSWISDRLANCYEEELGRRIRFLGDLASGRLDAGRHL
jgi:uncharacterized protein YecT (DUF1311 family)